MKKTAIAVLALIATIFSACHSTEKEGNELCKIHGTANSRLDGIKIFLVPMEGPATMETVDSVVIKDCKFEFESNCGEMKVIRVDYRHRMGVEDLLLVMEKGDIEVMIDSVSSGKGTPQNDSLQMWKERTVGHLKAMGAYRAQRNEAEKRGNQIVVKEMDIRLDSLQKAYKRYSRQLADNMREGVLHEFLDGRFPRSYKKKMPDGTITTIKVEY